MDHEKLNRFASNLISDQGEIEKIIDWIEASPDHQKEFNRIKNLWSFAGFKNFDILSKEAFGSTQRQPTRWKALQLNIMKYAAVFILAFLIGGYSFSILQDKIFSQDLAYNEILVPLGQSTEVILADHTHVWLNSGAQLIYPSRFQGKTREVRLTGEAYFEVHRNEKKPFHVITPDLTVNVLGTSFNVEAYENTAFVSVTLVKGKVTLENKKGEMLALLSPNENASYDTDKNKIEVSKINTSFYTSWKEGTILFRNEKLVDIARKLERWFNVEIVFDQESVKELKFTGSILKNKPIDQIMEILKYTSNVDYSIEVRDRNPNIVHLKKCL